MTTKRMAMVMVGVVALVAVLAYVIRFAHKSPPFVLGSKPERLWAIIKPTEYVDLQKPMVDVCRAWIQNLSPADTKSLQKQGWVEWSLDELRRRYPKQAELVKNYDDNKQALSARIAATQGRPSYRLVLQSVGIKRNEPGAFELYFSYGPHVFSNIIFSDPLPGK